MTSARGEAGRRLIVNGAGYHVEVHRSTAQRAGVPIVLLHGFTGSTRSWDEHLPALLDLADVIALDQLGHGRSDAPAQPARYRVERVVDDLTALLDALDAPRAHVVGYSMGGRVALQLAVSRPERVASLVLESASPGIASEAERAARVRSDDDLAELAERDGLAAFVDRWEGVPLFASQASLPPETRARLREQRLAGSAPGLAGSLRGMGAGQTPCLVDRLSELACPTLLLVGARDTRYVALGRAMAAAIPRARLMEVADAGHTIHLEQPARFGALVGAFLAEQIGAPGPIPPIAAAPSRPSRGVR